MPIVCQWPMVDLAFKQCKNACIDLCGVFEQLLLACSDQAFKVCAAFICTRALNSWHVAREMILFRFSLSMFINFNRSCIFATLISHDCDIKHSYLLSLHCTWWNSAHHLSSSELQTTVRELKAIAMLAIQGWRVTPSGTNTPAANGMPMKLYMTAQAKLRRMRRTVLRERIIAATTSLRLSWTVGIIHSNNYVKYWKFCYVRGDVLFISLQNLILSTVSKYYNIIISNLVLRSAPYGPKIIKLIIIRSRKENVEEQPGITGQ